MLTGKGWRRSVAAGLAACAVIVAVGTVAIDAGRFSQAPALTADPPVTLQTVLEVGSQERHAPYAFLRAEAPGARVIIDEASDSSMLSLTSLRALGGVSTIERQDLSGSGPAGGWVPEGVPDRVGRLRGAAWELHREPGNVDTVLVGIRDGRTLLVDRRSVPELAIPEWRGVAQAPEPPGMLRAVVVETGLFLGLVLLGGLVLPRSSDARFTRPALALLVGAALQALSGYLFLIGVGAMVSGIAVGLIIHRSLGWRGVETGWRREDLPVLAGTALTLAGAALVARWQGFVLVTADAIAHVERSIAIGSGTMGLADLNAKRPLALAAIQAPAHALGVEGLQAFGLAMLLAVAVVVTGLALHLAGRDPSARAVALVGAGAFSSVVFIAPMLRTVAAFLNTHLLVSALLVLLVALWATDDPPRPGITPVTSAVLLALLITRAESILLVVPVLLVTLAVRDESPAWSWAWPVVGAGLVAWNGLHVAAAVYGGVSPSLPVVGLTAAGLTLPVIGRTLLRLAPGVRRGAAVGAMALLWCVLLAILTSVVGSGARAVEGLRVNLGAGEGAWGVLAPLTVILVAAALVAGKALPERRLLLARWLTIAAVPSVLLAKAADGIDQAGADGATSVLGDLLTVGARVGSWGDSANRMWSHFVLVALALVVLTAVLAVCRPAADAPIRRGPHRGVVGQTVVVGMVGLALVALALTSWRPGYLGPPSPGSVATLLAAPDAGDVVRGPELTTGTRLEATVTVPRIELPDDATDVTLCATVRLTDLDRIVTGQTRLRLEGPMETVRLEFDEFAWSGTRIEELCIEDPGVAAGSVDVTVVASGGAGATAGEAAVLLLVPGPTRASLAPIDALEVRYVAASEDPRGPLRAAVSTVIRWVVRNGPVVVVGLLGLAALTAATLRPPRPADASDRRGPPGVAACPEAGQG